MRETITNTIVRLVNVGIHMMNHSFLLVKHANKANISTVPIIQVGVDVEYHMWHADSTHPEHEDILDPQLSLETTMTL